MKTSIKNGLVESLEDFWEESDSWMSCWLDSLEEFLEELQELLNMFLEGTLGQFQVKILEEFMEGMILERKI